MSETNDQPLICKNCQYTLTGKYCSNCGEKVYTHHDRSMMHLLEESAHFITHLDGNFFNTLRAIFTSPGKLSTDYCNGIRKKYFKPIPFFLLLVVIYLLFPVFEGLNMKLYYYLHNELFGKYATEKITGIMHNTGLTMPQLAEEFHRKSEKISKFLLLFIIPLTALFFQLFTFKKRPMFFDQVIFATEINIFFLLWGFLILPLIMMIGFYTVKLFNGTGIYGNDMWIGITVYVILGAYVARASQKFYSLTRVKALVLSALFIVVHGLIVQYIYKFILFQLITWQLH